MNQKPKFAKGCRVFSTRKGSDRLACFAIGRAGEPLSTNRMKAPVKLSGFVRESEDLRAQRHQLVVATTAAGELFWVEGVRIGDVSKLDNRTVYLLKWRWLVR